MAKKLYEESNISAIASAIKTKSGNSATMKVSEMASRISAIQTGGTGITPTGTKSITENGTHDVTSFASASVNVQPNLQQKTAKANGTVTPDSGYDGLSQVTVNVPTSGGSGGTSSGWLSQSISSVAQDDGYYTYTVTPSLYGKTTVPDVIYIGVSDTYKYDGTTYNVPIVWAKPNGTSISVRRTGGYVYLELDGDTLTIWTPFSGTRTIYALWI